MRLPLPAALCLVALAAPGCEERPTSVLDLSAGQGQRTEGHAAGRDPSPVAEVPLPELPEPAPNKEPWRPPQSHPVPAGIEAGQRLRYDFTVEPAPGDAFRRLTVEARYSVIRVVNDVVYLEVELVPGDGAHPVEHAYLGRLRVRGLLLDDLGVDLKAIGCAPTRARCAHAGRLPTAPRLVVEPLRPELTLTSHVVQHEQRFTNGRRRRVTLKSAETSVRGLADSVGRGPQEDTTVPPLTWTWRYLAAHLPPPTMKAREEQDVRGDVNDTQRLIILEARAAAMGMCRARFPRSDDRPWASFVLRVTWGKDRVSDVALKGNGEVTGAHPWVRCVERELERFLDLEPAGRLEAGRSVDVRFPVPD